MNTLNSKEQITDNELIAEFMGKEVHYVKGLKYDSLWDWLMPVVEKVNSLVDTGKMEGLDIDILRSMQDWITSVNIKNAHGDLVTIIKWHKTQNKKAIL